MKNIVLILASFLFIRCNHQSDIEIKTDTNFSHDTIKTEAVKENQEIYSDSMGLMVTELDSTEEILDFSWIQTENENFYISFDGENIQFGGDSIQAVKLYVRIESSISIQDEGKHCDLNQWIHGYTDWLKLTSLENYKIEDLGYTNFINPYIGQHEMKLPFPKKEMSEIKTQVKKSCGEYWSNHMKNCVSPYEYPCSVLPSAYIFKVIYTKAHHKSKTEYFRINIEMGC